MPRWPSLILAMLTWSAAALATPTQGTLSIETRIGAAPFKVEIVTTDADRELGLMNRRHLAADAGMLFLYDHDQPITMWMENTLIPLDMVFIRADGTIASIAERAVPMSRALIPSGGPVRAVLELNGGTASRLGLVPGDRIKGSGLPADDARPTPPPPPPAVTDRP